MNPLARLWQCRPDEDEGWIVETVIYGGECEYICTCDTKEAAEYIVEMQKNKLIADGDK